MAKQTSRHRDDSRHLRDGSHCDRVGARSGRSVGNGLRVGRAASSGQLPGVGTPIGGVARARGALEPATVEHGQHPAVVLDQATALQLAGGRGDADAANARACGPGTRASSERCRGGRDRCSSAASGRDAVRSGESAGRRQRSRAAPSGRRCSVRGRCGASRSAPARHEMRPCDSQGAAAALHHCVQGEVTTPRASCDPSMPSRPTIPTSRPGLPATAAISEMKPSMGK